MWNDDMNTKKQKKIREYLEQTTWPYILENILDKKDMTEKGILNPQSCFDMEDILKSLAVTFGLAAYSDDDDETPTE